MELKELIFEWRRTLVQVECLFTNFKLEFFSPSFIKLSFFFKVMSGWFMTASEQQVLLLLAVGHATLKSLSRFRLQCDFFFQREWDYNEVFKELNWNPRSQHNLQFSSFNNQNIQKPKFFHYEINLMVPNLHTLEMSEVNKIHNVLTCKLNSILKFIFTFSVLLVFSFYQLLLFVLIITINLFLPPILLLLLYAISA